MVTLLMHHDKLGGLAGRSGRSSPQNLEDGDDDDDFDLDADVGERPAKGGRRTRTAAKTVLAAVKTSTKVKSRRESRAVLRQGPPPEI